MLIKEVYLKNFKSHKESLIRFEEGTNVIIGISGSGKTSILQAINFSLFGASANIGKLENLIKNKPVNEKVAIVKLTFSQDGKDYVVERVIESGSKFSKAKLYENNKLVEAGSERINEKLEEILRIKVDTFTKVIYCEQDNIDFFFRLPRGERVKKIDEILYIEALEKVRKNSTRLSNDLRKNLESLRGVLGREDKNKLLAEKNQKELELIKLKNRTLEVKSLIENLRGEVERLENLIKENELKKEELNNLKILKSSLTSQLEVLQNDLNNLKREIFGLDRDRLEVEIKKLASEISSENKNLEELGKNINKVSAEISSIKKEIEINEKLINEVSLKIKELEKYKNQLENLKAIYGENIEKTLLEKKNLLEKNREEKYKVVAEINEALRYLEVLKTAESKCPVCEADLSKEKKQALEKHKSEHLKNLKSYLLEKENVLKNLEKDVGELEEAFKKYSELIIKLKDFESFVKDYSLRKETIEKLRIEEFRKNRELEDLQLKFSKLNDSLKSREKYLTQLEEKMKRVDEYESKLNKSEILKQEIESISKKISELEISILPNLDQIKENYVKRKSELSTLLSEEKFLIEKEKMLNEQLSKIEENLSKIEELEKEIDLIKKYLNFLDKFISIVKEVQSDIRNFFIKEVNLILPQIWNEIYPYKDYIELRIFFEDGDYILKVKDKFNRWYSIEEFGSGGEKALANLCFRIALSSFLAPNIKILLLDEPTHNLDVNAIELLKNALHANLNKFINQIILITHEERLEEAANAKIYKIVRNKDEYEESKVIQLR